MPFSPAYRLTIYEGFSDGGNGVYHLYMEDEYLMAMPLSMNETNEPYEDVDVHRKPKMRELREGDRLYRLSQWLNNPDGAPMDWIPASIGDKLPNQIRTRFEQPWPDFWGHSQRTLFNETENGVQKNWDCLERAGYDPESLYQQAIEEDAKRNKRLENPIGWPAWIVATKRAYDEKQRIDRGCGRK